MPFECEFAGTVKDADQVERRFHRAFAPYRHNPKREFFEIDPDQAIALLELLIDEDVTADASREASQVDVDSKAAADKLRKKPRFNFVDMGVPVGAELVFTHGEERTTCRVANERQVEYEGEVTSLTPLTTSLLGAKHSVQPTPYWTYQGKALIDLYNELHSA